VFLRGAPTTTPTGTKPQRTPEEQQLIEHLGRLEGHPLTEQEANFAVEQAKWMDSL